MADRKVTLKRVIDDQGNTDNILPTTTWDQVEEKPSTFPPTAHTHTVDDINSESQPEGRIILSDGLGGAIWAEGGSGFETKEYTTLTGNSDGWYDLFTIGDQTNGSLICSLGTYGHSDVLFAVSIGSQANNTGTLTVLNYNYDADTSAANVNGIRITDTGLVQIQLSWASGPSVDVKAALFGAGTLPTFAADLTENTNVYTVGQSVTLGQEAHQKIISNGLVVDQAFVSYSVDKEILEVTTPDGTVLEVGGELWFVNGKASGNISNGDVVQFAGVQGDHYLLKTAVPAEIAANQRLFVGLATKDASDGDWIKVTWFGEVSDIDTDGWTVGDILYFDNVNGGLTNTEPTTQPIIQVATVVAEETAGPANNGRLLVRPTFVSRKASEVFMSNGTNVETEVSNKVDKVDDKASTAQAEAGTDDSTYMTPAKVLDSILANAESGSASVTVSATEPTDPSPGDLWFDSTDLTLYLYYDDGQSQQWVSVSGESFTTIFVDEDPPSSPSVGTLWFDTVSLKLFIWYDDGTSEQWVNVLGSGETGGTSVTQSDTAPSNPSIGDLWFNSTNLTLYVYYDDGDSQQWVNAAGGITLGSEDIASQAEAEAGTSNEVIMTPLRTAQYVDAQRNVNNGLATLNSIGKVPSSQLPSFVDDVIEGYYNTGDSLFYEEDTFTTEITGEQSKIYINLTDNTSFRWSGSAYISISNPIDIASQSEAEAGTDNTKLMTPLRTKESVNANYSAGVIEDNASNNTKFWVGTQAEYDALTPDANTLYFITE